MGKTVRQTHITGEAGVIKFAAYCNQHKPYIFFREVLKSDFGIDGEIELTRVNEDRKIEPLGEVMKVQIKTVNSDSSYIRNERSESFEFFPRKEDVEYWEKYKKNGLEVLLVIYDQRVDQLYCKKVIDTDLFIAKQNISASRKKKTSSAVSFHKKDHLLEFGKHNFAEQYSASFKTRVLFGVKEVLQANYLNYKNHPKQMYVYESKYKNKKEIYEHIEQNEAPVFVIYNSLIYTACEIDSFYSGFKTKVLKDAASKFISYNEILEDRPLRNHYVELLNEYLKGLLKSKRLAYQKEYRRFYFFLPRDQEGVTIPAITRKLGQATEKEAVKKFTYGELTFFRHLALETKHYWIGKEPVLLIQPKYLFTNDGRTTLSPKAITKFTNYLTSREFNNAYCDWLYFWWIYLSDGEELVTYTDPAVANVTSVQKKSFYTKHIRIVLGRFQEFEIDFGIPMDKKNRRKAGLPDTGASTNLLFA